MSLLTSALAASGQPSSSSPTVLLVVGAVGAPEFGTNFQHQAALWQRACEQAHSRYVTLGLGSSGATNDLDLLRAWLDAEPNDGPTALWLVLIGHGTFDGKTARFNLRGPDLAAENLAQWLRPFHRPLAIIDTSSSSAPFLALLSATNRVVITATRSGHEQNYARFGGYFAQAIGSTEADLDKDGQVSLLEAFLIASRRVAEFYKLDGRLATEHALLDDNGDGLGTPADWFRGVRAIKRPKDNAAVDGLLASQFVLVPSAVEAKLTVAERARRDALEREVFALREQKSQTPEANYYHRLEDLLLQLAKVYPPETNVSRSTPE